MDKVEISERAQKDLVKIPHHIELKLQQFIASVEKSGYEYTIKSRGYDDKPLIGKRKGQRSIRLNRSYRAIYTITLTAFIFY